MKRAAIGIRMHSGWGVMVAVAQEAGLLEVLARRRIVTMDSRTAGSKQPYHHAANIGLPAAERYLANCTAASERVALAAVEDMKRELEERRYRVIGSALLLASGRALPPLPDILASHALIHAAEGEFFREAIKKACGGLSIPVTGIREKDLDGRARAVFGDATGAVQSRIATFGSSLGAPWTKDHKNAALAAAVILV
jgi:hypothetical protein